VSFPALHCFKWTRRRRAPAEERLVRLRKVLDYMDVKYPETDPESALDRLPPGPPPLSSGRTDLQIFEFPLSFTGRIALLEGGFRPRHNIREFAAADIGPIARYQPEAMVCPLHVALLLADQKERGLFNLPSLSVALVVLTRLDDSPLARCHRDLLWQAFRVPVFEQVLGWDGTVIARECEVHDGLHMAESAAIPHLHDDELLVTQLTFFEEPLVRVRTGLAAEIVTGLCECGSPTPRLRNLLPIAQKAASATGCD
jgi:hypothetical protein